MEEILEILEGNSRYTDEQIAFMAGKTVEEVREAIRDYEEKNIIAGYTTLINWENTVQDNVRGTATHFVLKKYKEHGTVFKEKKVSNREVIFI